MMAGYNHLADRLRIASRIETNRAEIEKHRDWCDFRHDLMTGFCNPPRSCDCNESGETGRNRHLNPQVRREDPNVPRELARQRKLARQNDPRISRELTDDNLRGAND